MDADVIIVGAGPTGLMLALELRLAGVRPLILERQPQLRETPKANGFSGQILSLERIAACSGSGGSAPEFSSSRRPKTSPPEPKMTRR